MSYRTQWYQDNPFIKGEKIERLENALQKEKCMYNQQE